MSKKTVIAEVRLAPGEVGYYDDYSHIYLNINRPSALIYSGTNCTQLKRSVKSGRLRLISGGFDVIPEEKKEVIKVNTSKAEKTEETVKEVIPEIIPEPVKEEPVVVEEVKAEVTEEPQVEVKEEVVAPAEVEVTEEAEAPKKRPRKSKKTEEEVKVEE